MDRLVQLGSKITGAIPRSGLIVLCLALGVGVLMLSREGANLATDDQAARQPSTASEAELASPELFARSRRAESAANPLREIPADAGLPRLPGTATPVSYAEEEATPPAAEKPAARVPAEPIVTRQLTLEQYTGRSLYAAFDPSLRQHMRVQTDDAGEFAFTVLLVPEARIDVIGGDRQLRLSGRQTVVDAWSKVIAALDQAPAAVQQKIQLIPAEKKSLPPVRKALSAVAVGSGERQPADGAEAAAAEKQAVVRRSLVAFRQPADAEGAPAGQPAANNPAENVPAQPAPEANQPTPAAESGENVPAGEDVPAPDPTGGVLGQVRVEFLEGLDVIVIRGRPADVDRVVQIINEIEELTSATQPRIEVWPLKHVASEQLAILLQPLYSQVLVARTGGVSITPLVKPNSLLLIGREESVAAVLDLIERLDVPADPSAQFRVFRLKHASALEVKITIDEFYANRTGLGPRVLATADDRSNSLIVNASPRDLAEVAALLAKLDTSTSDSVNELRVFQLQNALAVELAAVLNEAVAVQAGGQRGGAGAGGQQFQLPQLPQGGAGGAGQQARVQQARTVMLNFLTIDANGGEQQFRSGILRDVKITADARANSLVVSAPAASLGLIAALIEQLDQLPAAESQIKVFTIANSDAASLVEMLQSLFGSQASGGARNAGALAIGGAGGQDNLVRLRFSVDQRTNSIIASGTATDLTVVEALLLRLDESDIRQRKSVVYRLKNAPATDVANAVNELLRSERQVQQTNPGLLSPFEQIEREVVVVPEPVSNSLIVSATPRYFEEIRKIVEQLDERPPMVMIQVLIGEVTLNDVDEFGVEFGFQDSLLFDRGLIGDLLTTNTTTTTTTPGGAVQTVQAQTIQSATITPGFNFNNLPLGNSASDLSLSTRENLAAQGLSNFALGRVNNELGFGGFVFSAGNESISLLLRALQETRRLEVLSRPQIMTLDNQPAFIQVGQRVPRITGTTINQTGQVNNIQLENVGLILGVTPRISPDGLVVMEIDAEKSEVGPESEGIPISIAADGEVIRSPRVNISTAQTTVSALSGQTVVLGGLITKSSLEVHRRLPFVADIPIIGWLFRYDSQTVRRTELLIVMTPRIVRNEMDVEVLKRTESSRMSWVLSDVIDLHGEAGLLSRCSDWSDPETQVILPNQEFEQNYFPPQGAAGAKPVLQAGNPLQPVPQQQSVLAPQPVAVPQARTEPTPANTPTPAMQPVNMQPADMPHANMQPAHMPQQFQQPVVPGGYNGPLGNEYQGNVTPAQYIPTNNPAYSGVPSGYAVPTSPTPLPR